MKKTVFLCLLLCNVFCVYSKDYTFQIFKNSFEKTDKTYDYNVRNPLFVDKFYITDLKKLKNKIIKKTVERYYMDEQKRKSYSDSYIRTVGYLYYFFDSDGRMTEYYYIDLNDEGTVFYKQHESYNCFETSYEIIQEDYINEIRKDINAKIEEKDNQVILTFSSVYDGAKEIIFQKNKIEKKRVLSKSITSIKELLIDNNKIQKNEYSIKKDEIDYWGITYLENNCQIEQKRFVPDGNEFYKYELDDSGHGFYTFFKEGKSADKAIKQEVYRKFNSIGFLEYEECKPYKTEAGDYSFMKAEILDKPDAIWNEYFKLK